jgi:hypothetical protein
LRNALKHFRVREDVFADNSRVGVQKEIDERVVSYRRSWVAVDVSERSASAAFPIDKRAITVKSQRGGFASFEGCPSVVAHAFSHKAEQYQTVCDQGRKLDQRR